MSNVACQLQTHVGPDHSAIFTSAEPQKTLGCVQDGGGSANLRFAAGQQTGRDDSTLGLGALVIDMHFVPEKFRVPTQTEGNKYLRPPLHRHRHFSLATSTSCPRTSYIQFR